MDRKINRYAKLEKAMTIALGSAQGLFILYMIAAGCGIGWLKWLCATLCVLAGAGAFAYLYLTQEWRKRRSLWLSAWAVALVIFTVFSLILQFPSPHPAGCHNPRLSRGLDLALEGLFTDDCP